VNRLPNVTEVFEAQEAVRLGAKPLTVAMMAYAAYFSGMVDVQFPMDVIQHHCGQCHDAKPGSQPRLAWEGRDARFWTKIPLKFGGAGPPPTMTRPCRSTPWPPIRRTGARSGTSHSSRHIPMT
jgi:hypothetical protein